MAALSTIAAVSMLAEAGYSAWKTAHQPKAQAPTPTAMPIAPKPDPAGAAAAVAPFRPRARSTATPTRPTDLTGPSGLAAAPTTQTTLLGL